MTLLTKNKQKKTYYANLSLKGPMFLRRDSNLLLSTDNLDSGRYSDINNNSVTTKVQKVTELHVSKHGLLRCLRTLGLDAKIR